MKILYVLNNYPPNIIGGAELIAHKHLKVLKKMGHHCEAFVGDPNSKSPVYTSKRGIYENIFVTRVALTGREFDSAYENFRNDKLNTLFEEHLNKFRPCIVHFHNLPGLSVDFIDLAKEQNSATFLTVHDHWGFCHRQTLTRANGAICTNFSECDKCRPFYLDKDHNHQPMLNRNRIIKEKFKKLDALISPSLYLLNQYEKANFCAANNFHIEYGLDLEMYSRQGKQKSQRLIFGAASYLGDHKGIRTLIKAISLLPIGINAKFLIAGQGVLEQEIKNFIDEDKNGHLLEFVGFIPHEAMSSFYRQLDVFVCPSEWPENQPLTIMEAMASGLAIITTSCGGSKELVKNYENGILILPKESECLKNAFLFYLQKPYFADMHGEVSRRIISRYNMQRQIRLLTEKYQQSIFKRGGTKPV